MKLTLFFDSYCPLCVAEMDELARLDALNENPGLIFEDIHAEDFLTRHPDIDPAAVDRVLHARYEDGRLVYGLDVTHQAWATVGRQRWLAISRWPIIRWFADLAYRLFARYRYSISFLLTGQRRCEPCARSRAGDCELP